MTKAKAGLEKATNKFTDSLKAGMKEDPKVDKSELEKAFEAAEEAKKDIKTSIDGKDVEPADKWTTSEEMQALEAAINEAKKVNEDADAKQEAVDAQKDKLEKAIENFKKSVKAGLKVKKANKPKEPEKPTEPNKPKEPDRPTKQNNSKKSNKSTLEIKVEKKEQEISQTKNEELPKTGERKSAMDTMVGFISIVVSMLLFIKKEKRQI